MESVEKVNVEEHNKELERKRRIVGFTSNSYGRVVLLSLLEYMNMIGKNETLRDENGLNDNFVELTEEENITLSNRNIDEEEYTKIMVEKISKLRNFMTRIKKLPFDKMDITEAVYKELLKKKVVNNDDVIKEKDQEIKKLEAQLKQYQKKAPTKEEAPKEETLPPAVEAPKEDDPFV